MTGEQLLRKMNDIEDGDILRAETASGKKLRAGRWLAAAAAALVLGVGIFAINRFVKDPGSEHSAFVPTEAPIGTTEGPIETEGPAATEAAETTPGPGATMAPPFVIEFHGIGEYRDFAALPELDDDDLLEFLGGSSYGMNGVNTRQDVKNVLEVMDSVPMPQIEGFPFWRSSLCFDADYIGLYFRSEGDERHYIGFIASISQSSETVEERAAEAGHGTEEVSVEGIPELRYLLRAESGDPANPNSYYYTNIRSHRVTIVTDLAEEELLSILQGCRYTVISEYAGD